MSARLRKAMLTGHIATSVGWLGAIMAYVALNVPAVASDDEQLVRAAYLMMEPVIVYAVTPLAVMSTLTGIAQALATPWGLFRHYWVLVSLLISVLATAILLLHLPAVTRMAGRASDPRVPVEALTPDLVHSIASLIVLLIPLGLNIYKPRGLTRYGWRHQRPRPAESHTL